MAARKIGLVAIYLSLDREPCLAIARLADEEGKGFPHFFGTLAQSSLNRLMPMSVRGWLNIFFRTS